MNILNFKKIGLIFCVAIFAIFLSLSSITFAAKKGSGPTLIQFASSDGFNIVGDLDIPKGASAKKKVPLVIFLHSLGKSKLAWYDYPERVKALGAATLNLDLRGHGQSIIDKHNKKKYWQNFKLTEFKKFPGDVISAINYIKEEYPEINTNKIAIVGADIGANTSIIAGSKNTRNIKTLVLLSPTTTNKGLDVRIPMVGYGNHPVLFMASKNDKFSYYATEELIKYAQGIKFLKAFPYGGNGINLLRFQPESQQIVIDWLKKYFISTN